MSLLVKRVTREWSVASGTQRGKCGNSGRETTRLHGDGAPGDQQRVLETDLADKAGNRTDQAQAIVGRAEDTSTFGREGEGDFVL